MLRVVVFIFLINFSSCQREGKVCTKNDGSGGVCVRFSLCESAIKLLEENNIRPKICSFVGLESVVCCDANPALKTDATTSKTTVETTTTTTESFIANGFNSSLPTRETTTEGTVGVKAGRKCVEYLFNSASQPVISSGEETDYGEFPYMALLGYQINREPITFLCGGTIISEKFVLTAAHCTHTKPYGNVKYALIDTINKIDYNNDKLKKIKNIINHPKYEIPVKYYDIALLELETPLVISRTVVPACLNFLGSNMKEAIATGWGLTSERGNPSEVLLKVTLERFADSVCTDYYKPNDGMKHGFDPSTQLCFGSSNSSKDTCQGDNGGPLLVKKVPNIGDMYEIIGVTAFGRICGSTGEPAIYTRVSAFVEWIEGIVWPE